MIYSQLLENERATLEIGKKVAASVGNLHVIYLEGVLGAGKTTFT
ncbi:MAG TPA: tRNA (adenosine(37)-N6)-threonylcarbamoyltransferase complex ATPase subunit type 1 TsaE, partial [Gammaproteobacteria bacterium]|nr:tRNA (adenosine(37)-N6)-threonylcarbamoyltransferase complex ATPase subunit type 1 TsaE [Gammaproteobacteria bacterium]